MLLQKRILFFSPPPVGVACYRGRRVIITYVFVKWKGLLKNTHVDLWPLDYYLRNFCNLIG